MTDHTELVKRLRAARCWYSAFLIDDASTAAGVIEEYAATIVRLSAALERYMDLYYGAHTDAINEYSGNVKADTDAMCQSIAEDARALGVNPSCLGRDTP